MEAVLPCDHPLVQGEQGCGFISGPQFMFDEEGDATNWKALTLATWKQQRKLTPGLAAASGALCPGGDSPARPPQHNSHAASPFTYRKNNCRFRASKIVIHDDTLSDLFKSLTILFALFIYTVHSVTFSGFFGVSGDARGEIIKVRAPHCDAPGSRWGGIAPRSTSCLGWGEQGRERLF